MANSNNHQNFTPASMPNNNFNNQLDIATYYGIDTQDGCNGQGCVPNVVNRDEFLLPSIQEIADFSLSNIYNQPIGTNSPITTETAGQVSARTDSSASTLPEGIPETPATVLNYGATIDSGIQGSMGMNQITDIQNPYPVTPESLQYLNGFIRTQIGRRVSIDFLVGSNTIVTKSGYLLGVASNYILINELDTNDITTCDFYNIKFIRFYY